MTRSLDLAVIVTATMLFAGFMFGPDLDIQSKQYTRWGPFQVLWWPYKVIFKHRSRLSHGIILGTAIRVVYFSLVLMGLAVLWLYVDRLLHPQTAERPDLGQLAEQTWSTLKAVDRRYMIAAFLGLWWGAASHTLSDWVHGLWTNTRRIF